MTGSGVPGTMRAVALTGFGGPDRLELVELPVPVPGPGEVLIRVRTVAANRQDVFTMRGTSAARQLPLPHVLGIDPAGVVAALGPGVSTLAVGDRVVVKPAIACGRCSTCRAGEDDACPNHRNVGVHVQGGMAEYVAVSAANAFRIPDALGFAEATAFSHSVPVALQLLRERSGLRPGETVLVTSAAGAIGSAAVQLAKLLGARVIAAAGGEDRLALVARLGADVLIDYGRDPAFATAVRAAAPDGVDLYVESAGNPAVWPEAVSTLARRGRIAVCGSHAGGRVELDLNWLFRQRVAILGASGSSLRTYRDALELVGAGRVRAAVHGILPLDRAAEAFGILLRRENRGKVVLRVADD